MLRPLCDSAVRGLGTLQQQCEGSGRSQPDDAGIAVRWRVAIRRHDEADDRQFQAGAWGAGGDDILAGVCGIVRHWRCGVLGDGSEAVVTRS